MLLKQLKFSGPISSREIIAEEVFPPVECDNVLIMHLFMRKTCVILKTGVKTEEHVVVFSPAFKKRRKYKKLKIGEIILCIPYTLIILIEKKKMI